MIEHFEKLTREEMGLLLKAPALVSVLAINGNNAVSKEAKADAIKLAHLKTYTAVPLLRPYYKEVETDFKDHLEAMIKRYTPFDEAHRTELMGEIRELNHVISKLDKEYAATLLWSLSKYAAHVKKSDRVLLENFIFPFKIPGLTD